MKVPRLARSLVLIPALVGSMLLPAAMAPASASAASSGGSLSVVGATWSENAAGQVRLRQLDLQVQPPAQTQGMVSVPPPSEHWVASSFPTSQYGEIDASLGDCVSQMLAAMKIAGTLTCPAPSGSPVVFGFLFNSNGDVAQITDAPPNAPSDQIPAQQQSSQSQQSPAPQQTPAPTGSLAGCSTPNWQFQFNGQSEVPGAADVAPGAPALIVCNGTTYVPARFLSNAEGAHITWSAGQNGAEATIVIQVPWTIPSPPAIPNTSSTAPSN